MPVTRGPAPVTGYETAPLPIGPLTQPPPQGGGVSSFVMPLAPRATTMNTSTRFIEIDYNGNIITTAVTSMDFTGPGVVVSNIGSAVTINIPGGNGTPTGPNNSLQFNSSGYLVGNSNLVFDPSTNILSVVGNVHAGYFVGDGTRLSNITGANIIGQIPFAATANTANTASTVTTAAQPNITSVGTLTSVTVAGNIAGNYFIGNGSQLTGVVTNYSNVNVSAYLGAGQVANIIPAGNGVYTLGNAHCYWSGVYASQVSASGNVSGQYFIGNGSQLSGISGYSDANVANLLAGFGSNVISTTGNVTSGNLLTSGRVSATGNITGGNIIATTHTGTTLSVTGNVTGGNLLSTGKISTTGDITGGNVNAGATIVATSHTGATFSASGNITGGNLNTTAQVIATGNVTGGNIYTVGLISATGNITGGNIIGNIVGAGAGTPTIASTTNLDLSAASAVRVIGGGTFRLPTLTTAQIANLTAVNGDMVYNSTTAKIQAYANNAWGNITLS